MNANTATAIVLVAMWVAIVVICYTSQVGGVMLAGLGALVTGITLDNIIHNW